MNAPADTAPTFDPYTVDWEAYHHAESAWWREGRELLHHSEGVHRYFDEHPEHPEHPEHASDKRRAERGIC
ncbi:MAG TPA: hypothetical protein VER39_02515 [Nocardioidaceae bacterium]|nr:hypothetical protein [Nocardioidaceae bacterium]